MDISFTQHIIELNKTNSDLGAKTERLIADVAAQNPKIEDNRHQIDDILRTIAFVKGALWVIGVIMVFLIGIAEAYVKDRISNDATHPPVSAPGQR